MNGKKKETKGLAQNEATELAIKKSTSELPPYYNSEPSAQPPQYNKSSSRRPGTGSPSFRQHASAANVNAILASPDITGPDKRREKLPWRQRWKEWWQSWEVHDHEVNYDRDYGSQPKLNYLGARIDGGETKSRRHR
ncbi:hypothetical protein DM02DRAFT_730004 [Periconia macrospinosa]|uniref:Uncharacterized protein n=1 Tax=Periconia macrospinosa TaxID=97972 RepID=A0A2V1DMB6_9PLEO|nr:hypothetical protein DM02DRAFT_730004 [Periconia macrospinosa]